MPKPIFRITGSKTKQSLSDAVAVIDAVATTDTRLVEPFCGSGSVSLFSKQKRVLLADLQPNIIIALLAAKHRPESLLIAFNSLRENFLADPEKKRFYEIRDAPPQDAIPRAAWFIFIVHACFNWLWRVNSKGKCNTTFGDVAGIRRLTKAMQRNDVLDFSAWLNAGDKQIKHADAFDTIAMCGENDLIHVDPPYAKQFDQYNAHPFRLSGHSRMKDALQEAWTRGSSIVFHCNADKEVAAMYQDFCSILLRPVKRMVQGSKRAGTGPNAWEMLIVSDDQQGNLFNKGEELERCLGGTVKPIYNDQEKLWETWTPSL